MKPIQFHKIENLDDLHSYGGYYKVRKSLQLSFGFSIKSRDAHELISIIKAMKTAVLAENNQWQNLLKSEANIKAFGSFNLAKNQLSNKLGIKIPARSWQQLRLRLSTIINTFSYTNSSNENRSLEAKVAYYEKNKRDNFIASSKLEGLNVKSHNLSVEELVKKHTQTSVIYNG